MTLAKTCKHGVLIYERCPDCESPGYGPPTGCPEVLNSYGMWCVKPAGHDGPHRDGNAFEWSTDDVPADPDDDLSVPTKGPTGMCGCDPKFQPDRSICRMAGVLDACPCRCHHPRWAEPADTHSHDSLFRCVECGYWHPKHAAADDLHKRIEAALGCAMCVMERFRDGRTWQAHEQGDYERVRALWDELHNNVVARTADSNSASPGDTR